VTAKITQALKYVGVRVLDHIIVGRTREDCFSFAGRDGVREARPCQADHGRTPARFTAHDWKGGGPERLLVDRPSLANQWNQ